MFIHEFITVYQVLCFWVLFTCVHAYIYSGDASYWGISGLLIGYQLHHGGCASCTDLNIILYSQQCVMFQSMSILLLLQNALGRNYYCVGVCISAMLCTMC